MIASGALLIMSVQCSAVARTCDKAHLSITAEICQLDTTQNDPRKPIGNANLCTARNCVKTLNEMVGCALFDGRTMQLWHSKPCSCGTAHVVENAMPKFDEIMIAFF